MYMHVHVADTDAQHRERRQGPCSARDGQGSPSARRCAMCRGQEIWAGIRRRGFKWARLQWAGKGPQPVVRSRRPPPTPSSSESSRISSSSSSSSMGFDVPSGEVEDAEEHFSDAPLLPPPPPPLPPDAPPSPAPPLPSPPPPSPSSSCWIRFSFVRLFWNHTFTCEWMHTFVTDNSRHWRFAFHTDNVHSICTVIITNIIIHSFYPLSLIL